jgi:NADH:ubiquinone oxidoreductase subunit
MTTFGTLIFTWAKGRKIGIDQEGNTYYIERKAPKGRQPRRWVIYNAAKGADEASRVPPEWHAWLHYTVDKPVLDAPRATWQKEHLPNRTGTANAYLPPGHDLRGGRRERAAGDYEAWQP